MKEKILSESAPKPIGPYNQAILTGKTLYISGQIPLDPHTGTLISNNIKSETKQVMTNIEEILKEANMGFDNIVKSTIFIKNMNDFSIINEIYGRYFVEIAPARETVEVSKLPLDANIEISCIAVKE